MLRPRAEWRELLSNPVYGAAAAVARRHSVAAPVGRPSPDGRLEDRSAQQIGELLGGTGSVPGLSGLLGELERQPEESRPGHAVLRACGTLA